jgi:hypothetical protein
MVIKGTAAALRCRGDGRGIETKTSGPSKPTPPHDQATQHEALALLTRAYSPDFALLDDVIGGRP